MARPIRVSLRDLILRHRHACRRGRIEPAEFDVLAGALIRHGPVEVEGAIWYATPENAGGASVDSRPVADPATIVVEYEGE